MKTIIRLQFKQITAFLLVTAICCWSCGSKQGSSDNTMDQASKTVTSEAPAMDIFTAVLTGNLDAVNGHIKAGTGLDQKDEFGTTPLIIASTFGKTDVAIALINAGADLNLKSDEGSTPLHTAAFFCRTEIVNALLENGADKTVKNNYGSTPYESVAVSFETVKPIYDQISRDLGPLGLKLDYGQIENTRPVIAEMLK